MLVSSLKKSKKKLKKISRQHSREEEYSRRTVSSLKSHGSAAAQASARRREDEEVEEGTRNLTRAVVSPFDRSCSKGCQSSALKRSGSGTLNRGAPSSASVEKKRFIAPQ